MALKLKVCDEGGIALPQSIIGRLSLEEGDKVEVRVGTNALIFQRAADRLAEIQHFRDIWSKESVGEFLEREPVQVNGATTSAPLQLRALPATLLSEGTVQIELEESVPVFKASSSIQSRIEDLLAKNREEGLTTAEVAELDRYEKLDGYLSFINRVSRNLIKFD